MGAVWAGTPAGTKLESTEERCLLLTLSSTPASAQLSFLGNPRAPLPSDGSTDSGLGSQELAIRKMPHRRAHG